MEELQVALTRLDTACMQFEHEAVRALLLQIVQEYAPQCGIADFIWSSENKIERKIRVVK